MYNRYLSENPGIPPQPSPEPPLPSASPAALPSSALPSALPMLGTALRRSSGLMEKLRKTRLSGDDLIVLGVLLAALRDGGEQSLLLTLGLLLLGEN